MILVATCLASVVVAAVVFCTVNPTYEASCFVRVAPAASKPSMVQADGEVLDPTLSTIVNLFTSPNVLAAAGASPKLASLPRFKSSTDIVPELRKLVAIKVIPGTYLIRVSMASGRSSEAAVVVNALVDAFLKCNEEFADGLSKNQGKSLENYLNNLKKEMNELEAKWKELVAKGDIDVLLSRQFKNMEVGGQAPISVEQMKRLSDELFSVHIELIQAEAWSQALLDDLRQSGPFFDAERIDRLVERRFRADPQVIALDDQISIAKRKLDQATSMQASPGDAAVTVAQRKFDQLRSQFNALWASKYKGYREQIVESNNVVSKLDLSEAESRVRSLKVKQGAMKAEAEKIQVGTRRSATDQVEIQLLLEKRESLRALQEATNRRLEQVKFEARNESKVARINLAEPPVRPISDFRPWLLMGISLSIFLASFAFFAFIESGFALRSPSVVHRRLGHHPRAQTVERAVVSAIPPGSD